MDNEMEISILYDKKVSVLAFVWTYFGITIKKNKP